MVVPAVVFYLLFAYVDHGAQQGEPPRAAVSTVARVIAFLWAWPYGIYHHDPFSFAVAGLVSLAFCLALFLRHDRRGLVGVLLLGLALGWGVATILGDVRGS